MMVANIYELDNCVKLKKKKIGFVTFDNKDAIFYYLSHVLGRVFFCVQPLNWTSIFSHQPFFSSIDRLVIVVCEYWNIECWCVCVPFFSGCCCCCSFVCFFNFNSLLWFRCELCFINRSISVESILLFKWSGCWASIVMTRSGM